MEAFYLSSREVWDIDGMYVSAPGILPKRKGSDLGRIIMKMLVFCLVWETMSGVHDEN